MSNPTLQSKLLKLAEFDKNAVNEHWNKVATLDDYESARYENARLTPLLLALIECAQALQDGCALIQHIQDLEYLVQGGSTEGWAHRWLGQAPQALSRIQALVKDVTE